MALARVSALQEQSRKEMFIQSTLKSASAAALAQMRVRWVQFHRMNNMRKFVFGALAALFLLLSATSAGAQELPKREFRGAWLHIVGNQTIKTMTTDQVKQWIAGTLDTLQMTGCNAVLFQVRPQADAFFESTLEPWTRFLTGEQGKAPTPYWDPLQFAIEESHKRGMELHAWLNPYRVTSNDKEVLAKDHIYFQHPERFVKYGKQLYFDPGVPENIDFTVKVIEDIVRRYDVDAIHFDDYFYPYPENYDFPDTASFAKYAAAQGFGPDQKADWRRNNVTTLIKEINKNIKAIKPWIRFGISPFGIHRNISEDPSGSATNGLSTYRDLYADIPLWCKEGYIDYNVPQLYWKIGYERADYDVLIHWWNDGNFGGHLYIGQSIGTFNEPDLKDSTKVQMEEKMRLVRELPNVHGNVWWPGWSIAQAGRPRRPSPRPEAANFRPRRPQINIMDSLMVTYQKYPALIPAYSHIDAIAPDPVAAIKASGKTLKWSVAPTADPMQEVGFYVVYRFPAGVDIDIEDSKYIVAITKDTQYVAEKKSPKATYVVTVTDHCWNESAPSDPVKM